MTKKQSARQLRNDKLGRARTSQASGAILLAAIMTMASLALTTMAIQRNLLEMAKLSRAREQVACARLAAASGLVIGPPGLGKAAADLLPGTSTLTVSARRGPRGCILEAVAICGEAQRKRALALNSPTACETPRQALSAGQP